LTLRAYVDLGGLSPEDVLVQAAYGPVDELDEIRSPEFAVLHHVEGYDSGQHRFDGEVPLERGGGFGYTVRVQPQHPLLASPAEMGLVGTA
jgi:starch phosphorylase